VLNDEVSYLILRGIGMFSPKEDINTSKYVVMKHGSPISLFSFLSFSFIGISISCRCRSREMTCKIMVTDN
jgi:hypothetical protein